MKSVEQKMSSENLGKAVKKIRVLSDLSQEELGNKIGLGKSDISKIETGSRKNITIASLAKIFEAMGAELNVTIKDNNGNEIFDSKDKE